MSPQKAKLEEIRQAVSELEAAASLMEPYLVRLDALLDFVNSQGDQMDWGRIPPQHNIPVSDLYNLHTSAEASFFRYLHLYPHAKDEWITVETKVFYRYSVTKFRRAIGEEISWLRKYAAYLRHKANLPAMRPSTAQKVYNVSGDFHMGDKYSNFTAAAVGRGATANNTVVQVWQNAAAELDLPELSSDLATLRPKLKEADPNGDYDEEIGQVASAEKAAKSGDGHKTLEHLKSTGKWVLETATKVGTAVAVKAIQTAIGLP